MNSPLINILIRTSERPALFKRCLDSVLNQSYKNISITVSCDTATTADYIPLDKVAIVITRKKPELSHYWNLYCNSLKSFVSDGWFFYLDDDDFLQSDNALANIAPYLNDSNKGVVCQMLRNGRPKPNEMLMDNKLIIKGRIGAPCLFLHSDHKNIADWDGEKAGDYRWIRDCAAQIEMKFVKIVVVQTGNNGLHGK